jgi:transcriptional regulator with XRE-family HTH domain
MSKLRAWRKSQNLTQDDAAGMFKIKASHLSMLETGKRTPSLSLALDIQTKTAGAVTPEDFPKAPT